MASYERIIDFVTLCAQLCVPVFLVFFGKHNISSFLHFFYDFAAPIPSYLFYLFIFCICMRKAPTSSYLIIVCKSLDIFLSYTRTCKKRTQKLFVRCSVLCRYFDFYLQWFENIHYFVLLLLMWLLHDTLQYCMIVNSELKMSQVCLLRKWIYFVNFLLGNVLLVWYACLTYSDGFRESKLFSGL